MTAQPVAAQLGGPLAGTAVSLVAGRLGVEASVPAIARELSENPDAAIRLAEIEADLARASMLDTQHARQTFGTHWAVIALTFAVLSLFSAALGALMLRELPAANSDIALLLIGQLSGFTGAALGYWFNTSIGSTRKQASLDQLTRREP